MKTHIRHRSRVFALQAIYQWQINTDSIINIKNQFAENINKNKKNKIDMNYFIYILEGVINNIDKIDEIIIQFLDRNIKKLDFIEKAVLRLATYELMECLDISHKIIINEALELTKEFGSIDGYKYVNGVLDKEAKELRKLEIKII